MLRIKSLFAGLALSTAFTLSAFAAPVTVDLAPSTNYYVDFFSYTSSEANFTVTGWSNKSSYNNTIIKDKIGRWKNSGLGVEMQNSPDHAVDNAGNDYDGLLFSFDKIVDVSSLGIGWFKDDADVSLLAYTGATAFDGSLEGTWANLLGSGWEVVGNYDRNGTGSFAVNTDGINAKYWLVGAYNQAFGSLDSQLALQSQSYDSKKKGGSKDKDKGKNKDKADYFKLNEITFEAFRPDSPPPPVDVPESGSLVLFMLGFIGLLMARRRTA